MELTSWIVTIDKIAPVEFIFNDFSPSHNDLGKSTNSSKRGENNKIEEPHILKGDPEETLARL